uniref:Fibronectin type III domain-containing protein n=1 Tax=Candidatus Kentrum sp. DK TaxID=2126562 RepID=A0A450TFW5_9GAMM|nr:MAG: Fibronectin type III domain-containing protein [Candidatus Kentron sp. DK]
MKIVDVRPGIIGWDDAHGPVDLPATGKGTLTNRERGKEIEYVASAHNKVGEGPASNGVVAVLWGVWGSHAACGNQRKQTAQQDLTDKMKADLRYAEQAVDFDDTKLKIIGWGAPREKTPLAAPGRALDLVIVEENEDSIRLAWKKTGDGGKPSAYEIRCRERDGSGPYRIAGMSMTTEVTLTDQEWGKELEYVVLARNKAGDGPVSNIVVAVL